MLMLPLIGTNDYAPGPYTVNVSPNDNEVTFSVLINEDNVFEGNESFVLNITGTSKPDSVVVGTTAQTTVTILDDDCEY